MLYPDIQDIPIEVFGGWTPAIPPSDLPPGAASIAQDVEFPMGTVRSRGGLLNYFSQNSPIPPNASINGLKSFVTPALAQRLLVWDSLGNFYKEKPQGTLNLVASRPYPNLFYQSTTLFGREYQAFFNSQGGYDIPRQYDDGFWDRVSQVGPGLAPTAADGDANTFSIVTTANQGFIISTFNNVGLSENGNVVTAVFPGGNAALLPSLQVGDYIYIPTAGVAAYQGTWQVTAIFGASAVQFNHPTTGLAAATCTLTLPLVEVFFTGTGFGAARNTPQQQLLQILPASLNIAGAGASVYNGVWPIRAQPGIVGGVTGPTGCVICITPSGSLSSLVNSQSGTGAVGHISGGLHQVSVAFITEQGFITQAAPPISYTAGGGRGVTLTNIPVGPFNINARLVLFTPFIPPPATTGSFYSLPTGISPFSIGMLIPDNTTTTLTLDFLDAVLIAGFNATYLFTQLELGESGFVIGYNSRLFWLGERAKVGNLVNLTFEGGWNLGGGTGGSDLPLGWTSDATRGTGGSRLSSGDWQDAYKIIGDGASAIRGMITQSAYQDYLLVPIIQPNVAYSIRCRAMVGGAPAQGSLAIELFSPTGGSFYTLTVPVANLSGVFQEFTGVGSIDLGTVPSDLILRVYSTGTLSNAGFIIVDSIEVFAANPPLVAFGVAQPSFNYSTMRASHAFNPESYDATTGQIQIRPGDGQRLRAGFTLRNNLYFGKDNYLCYVTDDGVNEPASWPVQEVSSTIGICGPNAVDSTEEWAVFAHRTGGYITWGGDPVKITPEIQEDASNTGQITWNSINWAAAYTIWVRIDRTNKMILFGVPVNGASTPNYVFMLDYKWLESPQEIAGTPLVTYSAFTGKMLAHGRGRRWSGWNITANCMTFAERTDGTAQPFFGSGFTNGKVYQKIPAPTQTSDDGEAIDSRYRSYGAPSPMEEQMLRFSSHRKLLGYLKFRAIGAGSLFLTIISANRTTTLRSYTLSANPTGDGERPVNIHGERFYVEVSTNAVGQWFQLERLIPCLKKDAAIPVRGVSV